MDLGFGFGGLHLLSEVNPDDFEPPPPGLDLLVLYSYFKQFIYVSGQKIRWSDDYRGGVDVNG